MSEMGIPMKLVKLTRAALKRVRSMVKIHSTTSETFETKRGLRQGDSLSCYLFNLALEKVIRNAKLDIRGNIYTRTVQLLAYADDLVIVGRTIQATKESFMVLETSARKMGIAVNEKKTKFMEVGKKITTVAHFTVGNYKFEKLHKFRYLGSLVTDKNDISVEIKNRTGLGKKCYYGLRKHLGSRNISTGTKCLIYKTLIRPIVTYGAECWVLTKKDALQLAVFERKVLRKIFCPI
jgi:hypothetical protein